MISPHQIPIFPSDKIPKILHRTLLYEEKFPSHLLPFIETSMKLHPGFIHVLWRERDVLEILSPWEQQQYKKLILIQKSDAARYAILRKYGGLYLDFDIDCLEPLGGFIENHQQKDAIVWTEFYISLAHCEYIGKTNFIRGGIPEAPHRIANYALACQPGSNFIQKVLQTMWARVALPIMTDYDVIYTTGPDVVSTVIAEMGSSPSMELEIVSLEKANQQIKHYAVGHWRTSSHN